MRNFKRERSKYNMPPAVSLLLLTVLWSFKVLALYHTAILLTGLALGFIMQRSRLCVASAFTDLLLFQDGQLFKAVLAFISLSLVGFWGLQYFGFEGYVVALSWRTILGALLFGVGMVLAGGCAAGCLMRLGGGYLLFIPVFIGLLAGSTLGAYHYDWWNKADHFSKTVFLPDLLGWGGAITFVVIILLGSWLLVLRYEQK